MKLETNPTGFTLSLDGRTILKHDTNAPCVFVGRGQDRIEMHRGHFEIEDRLVERCPLDLTPWSTDSGSCSPAGEGQQPRLILNVNVDGTSIAIETPDRVDQPVLDPYRGGSGRACLGRWRADVVFRPARPPFPLWTSEPGVGRDKTTEITFKADVAGKAGGDYWNTNYPQPTYLSSRALRAACRDHGLFRVRFSRPATSTKSKSGRCRNGSSCSRRRSFVELVETLSQRFGRQPPLPEWVYDGAIIGLKDGGELVRAARQDASRPASRCRACGARIGSASARPHSAPACSGTGRRTNHAIPTLRQRIAELQQRRHPFPRLRESLSLRRRIAVSGGGGGGLFRHRRIRSDGACRFRRVRLRDVDFTNPDAAAWFAEQDDRRQHARLRAFRLDGRFRRVSADRRASRQRRRRQADAQSRGRRCGPRSMPARSRAAARPATPCSSCAPGFTGVQKHCPLLWAGDQSVDFSRHDGLVTVICGALSSGLLGNAYHHSDIGGYTSLFGNVRTPELIMRWAEMAAFTPVMRTP